MERPVAVARAFAGMFDVLATEPDTPHTGSDPVAEGVQI